MAPESTRRRRYTDPLVRSNLVLSRMDLVAGVGHRKSHERSPISRPRNSSLAVALLLVFIVVVGVSGFPSTAPASAGSATTGPQRIIIDSDLSLWWDDATAVGMANVLEQRGKVKILAVMSDIRNPLAAAALDAIDTAYGHSRIPVGAVADSTANTAPHGYSDVLAEKLPHAIRNSSQAQPAVQLYRRVLAAQPDHSVTVVGHRRRHQLGRPPALQSGSRQFAFGTSPCCQPK